MGGENFREILEVSPINYFYCEVIKNSIGQIKDIIVIESNYRNFSNEKDLEILPKTFKDNNINLIEIIKKVLKNGKYKYGELEFTKLSEKRIVIWGNISNLGSENNLVKSKCFTKNLFNCIPTAIFLKDMKGRYVFFNKALEKHLALKTSDILWKKDNEIPLLKSDAEAFERTDKIVIENRMNIKFEQKLYNNMGIKHLEECIKSPFIDEYNNIRGVVGIIRDISKQKDFEKRMKRKEEVIKEIFDNIEDAIVFSSKEEILYANEAYEKLTGLNCNKVKGYNSIEILKQCIHDEDKWSLDNYDYKNEFECKFRIVKPDNKIKWIWFKANPIKNENGKIVRRVEVLTDITFEKKQQLELEELRTEFFANLSHEFRTPINLMSSAIQILMLKLQHDQVKDKEKYMEYICICKKNIFRLLKLMNNLTDSTKLSAGYLEYTPEDYDIVNFIEDISLSVAEFAKNHEINVIFDTEIEEKIISFDLEKMERIMLNLLSNSIKFGKKGGNITVLIQEVKDFIKISVEDDGLGIPKDKIDFIFDRFKNINNRLTKVNEGSGIGLYIVKALVELHNGKIEVDTEFGVGSKFTITIPNLSNGYSDEGYELYKSKKFSLSKMDVEFSDIYIN